MGHDLSGRKIGYCCITLNREAKTPSLVKFGSATVTFVDKLPAREAVAYLRELVERNCRALYETVNWLRKRPVGVRMFRITSNFFPLYTHKCARRAYAEGPWMNSIRDALAKVGALAREHDVRLSLHPGQHCVLNSLDDGVRARAIAEFEYHVGVATALGYRGRDRDDFCINVHGGKGYTATGVASWDHSWKRLSADARRLITLENDEFSWSARQIYALCQHLGARMVLDVHHHWVHTGRWINPAGSGVDAIRELWGSRPPKIHLSQCEPRFVDGSSDSPAGLQQPPAPLPMARPDVVKTKLRTHSAYIWHPMMPRYVAAWHRAGFDVQVETKAKNLASFPLYQAVRKEHYAKTC